ncbi:hypothetical protein RKE30_38410 [Streptomyces sp. Li-HN-5-11]|uniref:hypothetical protein n=1 Tax=Streptomyces sp. Li-HN-5-11 TaxID=3075432 RepID=UPI0028B1D133|nr:hypothetical protein [Streptomyces sp. Li-HN-5-11]WNM35814.1 hypothetical protein RKE30_38410 [Streptomyces sp. Li-HN-5-11]
MSQRSRELKYARGPGLDTVAPQAPGGRGWAASLSHECGYVGRSEIGLNPMGWQISSATPVLGGPGSVAEQSR